MISSLQTWWRWLKHRAPNNAILWLLASGLAIGLVWWNWPDIEQKPFVKDILAVLTPGAALPVAERGAYSVLLADLTGETDEQMVTNIADSLNGLEGVHAARLKRALPGDAAPQTLSKVRQYLRETGFDVLIWGQVIRQDDRSVPKLYLEHASPREEKRLARQGRYALAESTLELPELFWSDLRAILQLKIASDASVAYEPGTYKADRLRLVIEKIARLTRSNDFLRWSQDTRAAIWQSAAASYAVLGEQSGEEEWLHRAIVTYREALAERTRERVPLQWAMTQNNLGNALSTLGERESGTARLEEAVAAYQAALEEYTRERVPLLWAMTQNNLGNALSTLGERESGTARLEEAVVACRAALEELTRERVPLEWATTQNNLGNALSKLGEREIGNARLEEAVAAYRAALAERTRERVPLDWAATQNNLGNALWRLGERGSGNARLEEAVAAYRAALAERSRERVPLNWAATQNNLGNALRTLGERESGTARLQEAMAAYRAALAEYTRERVPLQWAMTQNNIGAALWTLGERESGTARLQEAVAASRAALEEYTRERVPLDWAMTQNNLGTALWRLGERKSAIDLLNGARTAFQSAYAIYKEARHAQYDDYFEDRLRSVERVIQRIEGRSATKERSSSR